MTKRKRVLIPGRFQPFHDGHLALIKAALADGYQVTVGIRGVEQGPDDPYSYAERVTMVRTAVKHLPESDQIQIRQMPEFDLIAYGRKPGWGMKEYVLSDHVQAISGTEARKASGGLVVWFTGNSGSGKTTIVNQLVAEHYPNAIILDGDEMRSSISTLASFTLPSRMVHNKRVARLAATHAARGHLVLVAVIAPTESIRKTVTEIADPKWVYTRRDKQWSNDGVERPYTPPEIRYIDHILLPDRTPLDKGATVLARAIAKWLYEAKNG